MNETFITLSINKFLNENNYQVIQCIPPGGQGSLNYLVNNKFIYPDFICFKNSELLIGENKLKFSESDEKKLSDLSLEKNLFSDSKRILQNYQVSNNLEILVLKKITLFMGFSSRELKRSNKFNNFLVDEDGTVKILKN